MTTKRKYNNCVYEQDAISRDLAKTTERIGQIEAAAGSNTSYKETSFYKELVAYSNKCETRKDYLDSQITLLDNQMKALKSRRDEDIKSETSIWCWA